MTSSRNFRTFLLMQQLAASEIGERIKQARREAGLTQDELADVVEVTTRTVQAWEGGDNIPYRKLSNLGEVLNREIGWFLHGDQEELPLDLQEELADSVRQLAEVAPRLAAVADRLEELLVAQPQAPASRKPT